MTSTFHLYKFLLCGDLLCGYGSSTKYEDKLPTRSSVVAYFGHRPYDV